MRDEAWRMKDVMKDEEWEMKDEGWDEGWEMKIDYSTSIMPEMLTARRPTPDWHLNETCLLFTGFGEDEGLRMIDEGWKWDEGWELAAYLNDTIKNGRVQLRLTAQHNNYTTVYGRRHRGRTQNHHSGTFHTIFNVFNAKPIHSIFGIYFLDGLVHRVLSSSSKQLESDCGVWGNPRSYNWCNWELSHWLEGSTPPTHGQFRLSLESLEWSGRHPPSQKFPPKNR